MSDKTAQKPQNGAPAPNAEKPKPKNKKKDLIEESPEDKKKREELAVLVERLQDQNVAVQKSALENLRNEIRSSTTSMTSIPKPLKFLRAHFAKIKEIQQQMPLGENNVVLCDILSVLALTSGKEGERESLHYKLKGNMGDLGTWGHEYVKNLSGEIGAEYEQRLDKKESVDDLMKLIDQIVPFDVKHNAEHEAVDLLLEVEQIEKILPHADDANYSRLCLYLINCSSYVTEPEDVKILRVALDIYTRLKKWPEAVRLSLRLNDIQAAVEMYKNITDESVKKQVAFILGRHHVFMTEEDPNAEIINNKSLSQHFLSLAKNLEILEAKTPEDVYKSSSDAKSFTANADNAKQNLASTYVNAFVNCAFGKDKLMTEEGNKWLYRNKEHGMIAAAASLGMIFLWNDEGLSQIDKYMYSTEEYVKAGALLGLGIVSANVRDEADPAFALLSEYLENPNNTIKQTAVFGLALAYSGSQREDLKDLLLPLVENPKSDMEVVGITSLALGIIFVGSAHPEITTILCQQLLEKPESALNSTYARFLCLALGLLYLGKQEQSDFSMEMIKAISHPIGKYAQATLEGCAYAGTGNVLKVQKLLDICGDHLEEKSSIHQGAAVLGLALVTMGEDIGAEMILRSMDHLLQYGEPGVRRAVPLALGLISLSNPRIQIMDTLSKLSHDIDEEVSMSAILALGFIGAGSNNARVAGLLKNLASYWSKDQNHLFIVRIAQGLLYMGKGTMTLAPYHSDRGLLSFSGLACLLAVFHGSLDLKNIILGKHHWLLFALAGSMHPRMLMTLDEKLQPLEVAVRVGQAVDTVGQAGKPKTITGFQTYTTPVLLGYDQRAELGTEEYIPLTPVLEGFVILAPNPNAPKDKEKDKIKIPVANKNVKS